LSQRALNRATLDRQLLLRRHPLPARQALRHLAGLQAQAPHAPYLGLWTRLARFTPEDLSDLLSERAVVRAPIMRATVHAVDAADFVAFRPLFDSLMAAGLRANYGRNLAGVDLAALAAAAAELLAECPLTRARLAAALSARWPDADPMSLAYVVTYLVPVVQVPPRGRWGKSAQATWTTAASWLSGTVDSAAPATHLAPAEDLIAAQPAERLVLRFLPAYDNLLLSHADRCRVNPAGRQVPLPPGNGATEGSLLIDGIWDATWKITPEGLTISPFRPLTAAERTAITEEAATLLTFVAPTAPLRDIRITTPT
jgi:hypothetical protein